MEPEILQAKVVEHLPKTKHYFAITRQKGHGHWFTVLGGSIDPRDPQAVIDLCLTGWGDDYEVKLLEVEL